MIRVEAHWGIARVQPEWPTKRLQDKVATLKARMKELEVIGVELENTPAKQISLTDPDARSMKTRGTGIVGYNVQTAVETKNRPISPKR